MRERYQSELRQKQLALRSALENLGISLPRQPKTNHNEVRFPEEWLVRGEISKNRLLNQEPFLPQSGNWATHGVFLGDCYSSLMYPDVGVFYVFLAIEISTQWIISPSEQYNQILRSFAEEHGLDLKSINGGFMAENFLYKQHPVYQVREGICTHNQPISLAQAHIILITRGFLSKQEIDSLPTLIRNKLITLEY